MRYSYFLVAALCAVASPVMAQDSGVYAGVEGGASFPQSTSYDVTATRVQTVPTGRGLLGQTVTTTNTLYRNGFNSANKTGFDVDAVAGYDFGFVRIEGELGYKRNGVRNLTPSSFLLTDTNTAPISGVTSSSFMSRNRISVLSGVLSRLQITI